MDGASGVIASLDTPLMWSPYNVPSWWSCSSTSSQQWLLQCPSLRVMVSECSVPDPSPSAFLQISVANTVPCASGILLSVACLSRRIQYWTSCEEWCDTICQADNISCFDDSCNAFVRCYYPWTLPILEVETCSHLKVWLDADALASVTNRWNLRAIL